MEASALERTCVTLAAEDPTSPVHLHPLLLLNISDHVTRMDYISYLRRRRLSTPAPSPQANSAEPNADTASAAPTSCKDDAPGVSSSATEAEAATSLAPVLGILFGRQENGTTEIITSYEVVFRGDMGEEVDIPHPPTDSLVHHPPTSVFALEHNRTEEVGWSPMQARRRWYVEQVDWEAVRNKRDRLMDVYPENHVVGWYTVGDRVGDLVACAELHRRLCNVFTGAEESTLLSVLFNPLPPAAQSGLPVHVFEMHLLRQQRIGGAKEPPLRKEDAVLAASREGRSTWRVCMPPAPTATEEGEDEGVASATASAAVSTTTASEAVEDVVAFVNVRFAVQSEELEHISVDAAVNVDSDAAKEAPHTAALIAAINERVGGGGGDGLLSSSAVNASLIAQALQQGAHLRPNIARLRRSLLMLRQRITLLVAYLEAVQSGTVTAEADAETLRAIASVCAKLPCEPPRYDLHSVNDAVTGERTLFADPLSVAPASSPSPFSTTSGAPPNVVDEELLRTLTVALLAQQSKAALQLQQLEQDQSQVMSNIHAAVEMRRLEMLKPERDEEHSNYEKLDVRMRRRRDKW